MTKRDLQTLSASESMAVLICLIERMEEIQNIMMAWADLVAQDIDHTADASPAERGTLQ